jgi:hypothetical protein
MSLCCTQINSGIGHLKLTQFCHPIVPPQFKPIWTERNKAHFPRFNRQWPLIPRSGHPTAICYLGVCRWGEAKKVVGKRVYLWDWPYKFWPSPSCLAISIHRKGRQLLAFSSEAFVGLGERGKADGRLMAGMNWKGGRVIWFGGCCFKYSLHSFCLMALMIWGTSVDHTTPRGKREEGFEKELDGRKTRMRLGKRTDRRGGNGPRGGFFNQKPIQNPSLDSCRFNTLSHCLFFLSFPPEGAKNNIELLFWTLCHWWVHENGLNKKKSKKKNWKYDFGRSSISPPIPIPFPFSKSLQTKRSNEWMWRKNSQQISSTFLFHFNNFIVFVVIIWTLKGRSA